VAEGTQHRFFQATPTIELTNLWIRTTRLALHGFADVGPEKVISSGIGLGS
jgi:hypothetical protein